ncbi:MAG: germination protein YpeB [Thermoanaerobacterales bacterium]|nr:germination protein YpeB [Thermoanaerobacterales bacterium]
MQRRWMLPAALSLLLLVAVSAWGFDQSRTRQGVETALNNQYQRAFYETLNHVQGLQVMLGKSLVTETEPLNTAVFADIWRQALMAQASLAQLPVTDVTLVRTTKFLNQVGDYANSLMRSAALGREPSEDHYATLKRLYDQAAVLNRQLHEVEQDVQKQGLGFWAIREQIRARSALRKPAPVNPGEDDFQALNREMEVYPTLIYDGPFSDHLERRTPLGLPEERISAAEARTRALKAVDRRQGITYTARVTGSTRGLLESYRVEITGKRQGGDEIIVADLTKQGGETVWYLSSRPIGAARISVAEAQARAERFLAARGRANTTPTFHQRQWNTVVYNFAGLKDGVVLYPDLVKVTVALDNGQVVGLEQAGWLMMHHPRADLKPKLSEAEARKKLSSNLQVTASRLAVIPTDGGKEILTWEFRGTAGGNTYLVYINAENGREEKILELVGQPQGTLTM